ncbi:hypothetical protein ACIPYS_38970 [Kitasatospora sp. NPDC089913]|uniref:hypothetical protein n=1 Tax=Kitasatospora sp. NPDC089913 TaxID=3364080 RepID=UPI0038020B61
MGCRERRATRRDEDPSARVSAIGGGHLGDPHATATAEPGQEVIGVDVDRAEVDRLDAGGRPIRGAGLPGLSTRHTADGRLRFTRDSTGATSPTT